MSDIVDLADLANASLEDLAEYKRIIEKAFAEKQEKQKASVLDEISALVSKGGITAQDLAKHLGFKLAGADSEKAPRASKGQKVPPKYRDPATGKTWSGRGVKPKWLEGKEDQFKL